MIRFIILYFFLLKIREIITIMIPTINTDKNIPTPIPVLKIPSTTAQPENMVKSAINIVYIITLFFIL